MALVGIQKRGHPELVSGSTDCVVVAVIQESCSPGSVVAQKEENNGYWTETFQYDFYFYKRPTAQAVDYENPAGRQFLGDDG